mgnify:CR=1 FL=1
MLIKGSIHRPVVGWMGVGERVFGYARVSVAGEDITNQVKAIEDYCRARGYDLLMVFKDVVTGVSNPLERPEFRNMVRYAVENGIRKIVVYDLSRLGRSVFELFNTLRVLKEHGLLVEFVKHQELAGMDERSFTVFVTAIGLAAQLEREFMHQRLEQARLAGKRIGRRPVEIPVELVERYLSKGLSKKDVYRLLVAQGHLRYREKGEERVLSYTRFLKRLKVLGL